MTSQANKEKLSEFWSALYISWLVGLAGLPAAHDVYVIVVFVVFIKFIIVLLNGVNKQNLL